MLTAASQKIEITILGYIDNLENRLGIPNFIIEEVVELIENRSVK